MTRPETAPAASEAATGMEFEEFFREQHRRLFQSMYLLTGHVAEAEDLAQEALTRVLERWDKVALMESPAGYLYRTAFNLRRSRLRRLAVRARKAVAERPQDPFEDVVDTRTEVHRALSTLSREQRKALALTDWLGLTTEEAGRVLGIEAVAVRARVYRARQKLRKELGGDDG